MSVPNAPSGDPSMAFKAGFVSGLRHARGMAAVPHLTLQALGNEDDYSAGYHAGWLAKDRSLDELLTIVADTWAIYQSQSRPIW